MQNLHKQGKYTFSFFFFWKYTFSYIGRFNIKMSGLSNINNKLNSIPVNIIRSLLIHSFVFELKGWFTWKIEKNIQENSGKRRIISCKLLHILKCRIIVVILM